MRRIFVVLSLLLFVTAAVPVLAQDAPDPAAQPLFAQLYLESGFLPDPYIVPVISTGEIDASAWSEGCAGYIAAAPDVIVNYTGGGPLLRFFFYGDGDSVLAVVTPDGDILCNDDASLDDLRSQIEIENPADGAYAVFVGSYEIDLPAFGVLGLSEISEANFPLASIDLSTYLRPPARAAEIQVIAANSLPTSPIIFDSLNIDTEFTASNLPATAGGTQPVSQIMFTDSSESCAGFITLEPAFIINVEASTSLRLFFEGDAASTIVVTNARGTAYCDNAAEAGENLNPVLDLADAQGTYYVRLGTLMPEIVAVGSFTVTTDTSTEPVVLAPAGS